MEPLNRAARRLSLAVTITWAILVFLLAVKVRRNGASLGWLDAQGRRVAFGHVFGHPLLPGRTANQVIRLGGTVPFAVSVAAIIAVALLLRDRLSAVVAVLACPMALVATETIGKPLVGRREGYYQLYGFPSGHATVIAAVITLIGLVVYRRWRWRGLAIVAPIAGMVPLMSLALVRADWHRFSDTLGGALVGSGAVVGLAWLVSMVSMATTRSSPAERAS